MLRSLLATEGVAGLYRGMLLPLAGTSLETATLFTANGYLKRSLRERGLLAPDSELPLGYVLLAGGGTGFCVSWVLTPIELVKCRLQVSGQPIASSASQPGAALRHRAYLGPWDCLRRSLVEEGLPVLYRGHVATLLREVPGTACWFGAYETFLRAMTPPGARRADLPPWVVIAAGALGGMAYWGVMYPADTVKTHMQTAGLGGGAGAGGGGGGEAVRAAAGATEAVAGGSGPGRPLAGGRAGAGAPLGPSAGGVGVGSSSGGAFAAPGGSAPARFSSSSSAGGAGGARPSHASFVRTLTALYRAGGARSLYAGITPTLLRAAPSNAVIFLVYEEAIKVIDAAMLEEASSQS